MEGAPSKINPPNSHPSNPIHKAAMAAQSPRPKSQRPALKEWWWNNFGKPPNEETLSEKMKQHEINKTAIIIDVVGVVALLFMASRLHRLFQSSSKRNTTTARIKSQVCLAKKLMTLPAALKIKLTIAPIRPGSAEATFAPIVLRPSPIFSPHFFRALVIVPTTAPIVTPAARKMAVTIKPYFLKISLTLSRRGIALSLSPTWVCNRLSSSFLSAILSSAAPLSEGVVFSSWMTAWSSSFWHLRLFSHSFSSSRAFVLFSLSSFFLLSSFFALSLSAFACDFSLFFACFSSAATSFFFRIKIFLIILF